MSPDKRYKAKPKSPSKRRTVPVRTGPSSDDAHDIVFYVLPDGTAPARGFIKSTPPSVRASIMATIAAVAAAPPKRFSGGGRWEAMHGAMTGWFEVRADGSRKQPDSHYRVFCLLDYEAAGETKPLLVLVTGMSKPYRTVFTEAQYEAVRNMGQRYWAMNPRPIQR